MALEDLTGTKYLDDLNSSNPAAGDNVSQGDDHIRGIKNVLKLTFPNVDAAVTATPTELNYVDGVTSAVQTQLDAITANNWVTNARMADDAIDSAEIADGAIDTAHIADDQVTLAKMAGLARGKVIIGDSSGNPAALALGSSGQVLKSDGSDIAWAADSGLSTEEVQDIAGAMFTSNTETGITATYQDGDGTIDLVIGAGDIVNSMLADDAVDSDEIAAGAIDLAHMSSESVDEDNLYISNSGSNGQFLSKQSGNNGGLTWATVSSEDYIPDGSVMAFFQASAPTGWTKVTTQNDKMLRVVSGTGGGTGGGWAVSAGSNTGSESSHTHSVPAHGHSHNLSAGAHTLSTSQIPSHSHFFAKKRDDSQYNPPPHTRIQYMDTANNSSNTFNTGNAGGGSSHSHSTSGSIVNANADTSGTGSSHLHTIAAPQYIDVIICSKDA